MEDPPLLMGDRPLGMELLQVGDADIGQHRHIRLHDVQHAPHLPHVVDAHLEDAIAGSRTHLQHAQGKTNLAIEVAGSPDSVSMDRENGADRLLCGRFAAGTGHAHVLHVGVLFQFMGGKPLQRAQGILDRDKRNRAGGKQFGDMALGDDRGMGAERLRQRDEAGTIAVLAGKGEEKGSLLQVSGVNGDGIDRHAIRADQTSATRMRRESQGYGSREPHLNPRPPP